jgi:hypothetical protein
MGKGPILTRSCNCAVGVKIAGNIMSKLTQSHLKIQRPDSARKVSHSWNFAQWHSQKGDSHYQNNEIQKNELGQTQDCSDNYYGISI